MTDTAHKANLSMERQELSLNDAATHVLEECRTVVPGMQALFGFQLIAVFSATFEQQLSPGERFLHLAAIVLVTIAIALVMAPAALHRQTEPFAVSRRLVTISSRLLMASMVPLAIGICLDVYVIARIIAGSRAVAGVVAGFLLVVFLVFWLLMPRAVRRRGASDGSRG
jgi:DMSO reductase anchor subunit